MIHRKESGGRGESAFSFPPAACIRHPLKFLGRPQLCCQCCDLGILCSTSALPCEAALAGATSQ